MPTRHVNFARIAAKMPAVYESEPLAVPDILVRDIDEPMAERIKAIARERQWTINDTILHLLRHALGFDPEDIFHREMHDIAVLAGTWDSVETAAFRSAVEAFERRDGQPLFSAPADQPPK